MANALSHLNAGNAVPKVVIQYGSGMAGKYIAALVA
jgi:hypothetical protein